MENYYKSNSGLACSQVNTIYMRNVNQFFLIAESWTSGNFMVSVSNSVYISIAKKVQSS